MSEGRLYFEYQFDEQSPKICVTLSPESSLETVFMIFSGFLKCAGYSFDGEVELVEAEHRGEN